MLSDIISCLRQNGPLSLAELARQFQTDISAMEGMLQTLEQKKRLERLKTKCSTCKGCIEVKPEDVAIFRFVEKQQGKKKHA